VDGLYAFLIGITVFFAGLIFLLLLSFLLKYRRPGHIRIPHRESNNWLEAVWILIPLALTYVLSSYDTVMFMDIEAFKEKFRRGDS